MADAQGDTKGPISEHPDDALCADECLRPWTERVLRDGWGPLGRECVERIVADTPEDRILGAHALLDPGHVPSLFDLCMQRIVPMGVARALLEQRFPLIPRRRLRLHIVRDGKAQARPTRCARTKRRVDLAAKQQTIFCWPRWWVAACGCRADTAGSGCGSGGDCPRARLKAIPERDGLRMMARHWTIQVEACYLSALHGVCDDEAYCRGWDERDWRYVNGDDHVALERTRRCGRGMSAGMIALWRAGYHGMARATHPWEPRVLVAHFGATYSDHMRLPSGETRTSVVGDPLFGTRTSF